MKINKLIILLLCFNVFVFWQQFNNFYISEHKNLLDLWREIGTVKRSFSEVKNLTSKDLTNLKSEIEHCSDLLSQACQAAQTDVITLPSGDRVSNSIFFSKNLILCIK